MIAKITGFIEKNFTRVDVIFLTLASVIFIILRFPSLFEPYWYGDEGIYEVIGIALRQGRDLYSEIWDNKPPLLYLIYALFNGDQFWVRLSSLLVGLFSVITIFLISKKLFKNYLSIATSTVVFALGFGLPIIEGNIANAENFMVLPILISFYLLFCTDTKNNLKLVLAGLLLSFAFLIKIVALFDFIAFSLIFISLGFFETISFNKKAIHAEFKKAKNVFKEISIFAIAFIIPILLSFVYFLIVGALPDYFRAAFSQNVGYVGYANYFLFPMGFLFLKFGLLALTIILAFRFRKVLGRTGFVILVWVAFSLFNSYFSSRPYTHYLLVFLPAFALFVGYVFENRRLLIMTIPLLVLIFLAVDYNFSFYKKLIPYYSNFATFVQGGSVEKYQRFFDGNTPRDYNVANFVKANLEPSENIFLWGDSAQIYALSGKMPPGRYAVSYHITFYPSAIEETQKALEKARPKFIIQTKDDPAISNFLDGYELKYKVDNATIYEKQF